MMSNIIRVIIQTFIVIGAIVGVIILSQVGFYFAATQSPQWEYARRALACKKPNYDLRYCVDLSASDRKDFTNTTWKPLPCINTATSFYNDKHRAGNCNRFMANPARWEFTEVSEKEAVPGDLMLFIRHKDGARHAGVYTMNSLIGPLCANTNYPKDNFMHFMPVKPLLWVHWAGFYEVKYYRYEGE